MGVPTAFEGQNYSHLYVLLFPRNTEEREGHARYGEYQACSMNCPVCAECLEYFYEPLLTGILAQLDSVLYLVQSIRLPFSGFVLPNQAETPFKPRKTVFGPDSVNFVAWDPSPEGNEAARFLCTFILKIVSRPASNNLLYTTP